MQCPKCLKMMIRILSTPLKDSYQCTNPECKFIEEVPNVGTLNGEVKSVEP